MTVNNEEAVKTIVYNEESKKNQWSIKQAKIKAIELNNEIEIRGIKK